MTTWTPERVAAVTRLWNEGLTTAEIGRAIGMSKNAVVGKAHRLQLPPRPSPIRQGSSAPRAPRAAQRAPAQIAVVAQAKRRVPVPHPAVGTMACKWPIGHPDEAGFHFCGERALVGKPYCMDHYGRAYVAVKPRSDAA